MSSVLVISADGELVRVLKLALRDTPARVTLETTSTKTAADTYAQNPGSLVVLDLFLPGGNSGLDALKVMKRVNEAGLFLFLTRMRTRTVIERCFRLGAQDVLHYPVSTDILRDTILHRLALLPESDAEDFGDRSRKK